MFWFWSHETHGISAPGPGMEPVPPAPLGGEVLTPRLPGDSPGLQS